MCWALNIFFISVQTHMVVVSGGSWDFCNCMFCTRCGCKSSGCLDWGHWTVENRWVKGKKIQHCSSMYRFPLLSSGPVLRSSCGENLEKLTEGFPALTEQTRTAFWILASHSPWPWGSDPCPCRQSLEPEAEPLRTARGTCRGGVNLCAGSYVLVPRGWSYAGVPFQCHQLY